MNSGLRFTYKDRPYEVVVAPQAKVNGQWITSIVYKALYDDPVKKINKGKCFVRVDDGTEEWKEFSNSIMKSVDFKFKL